MSMVTRGGKRALLGACSSERQGRTEEWKERGREREGKEVKKKRREGKSTGQG